jgi:hypothetical protein
MMTKTLMAAFWALVIIGSVPWDRWYAYRKMPTPANLRICRYLGLLQILGLAGAGAALAGVAAARLTGTP